MAKERFEVINDMHINDKKENTTYVGVSPSFVEGKKVPQGGIVSMGVPHEQLLEINNGKRFPILLLVDKKEYTRRISQI
ncbi:hypothetical protein M1M25_gp097 [Tenacibaculum phage Gundel_1]|uniref:Uncharacterized protein n=1 Tax=Tenacibaculum phage Gundel_1 TaxID=2745672 RepID=A0A8E4ZMX6_9CAUD|nr:hypothetical protein M1M25_gp097 [Tenacibaculum phage Gundel_1]QQV91535.1 hypothetical protein Gundel1_97 [Tenacibaculum phage Gundel_1]